MRIVDPSYQILTPIVANDIYAAIERSARLCYKSETNASQDNLGELTSKLIRSGHSAMLEHGGMSVRFVCNRGVSHELVRHRMCSFAQESQRYCNYSQGKFGSEVTFIRPYKYEIGSPQYDHWLTAMEASEIHYLALLALGEPPEWSRGVLANDTKTEIDITANWREWRHIFSLRTPTTAHPQMRELMRPLACQLKLEVPLLFEDIDLVPLDYVQEMKKYGNYEIDLFASYPPR